MDDDNFIDDSGVDPSDRYGSDNEMRFAHDAPQVNASSFYTFNLSQFYVYATLLLFVSFFHQ